MTIASKLQAVLTYKEAIRQSIAGKGATIPEVTPLSDYPSIIDGITTGAPVVQLPSPIASVMQQFSVGLDTLKIKWVPGGDARIAVQRVLYKTGAIPTFDEPVSYIDVPAGLSECNISPVVPLTDYGVWIQTLDADGNIQTCRNGGNTGLVRVQNSLQGLIAEVQVPAAMLGVSYRVLRAQDSGEIFLCSQASATPGLYVLDQVNLTWSLLDAASYGYVYAFNTFDGKIMFWSGLYTRNSISNDHKMYDGSVFTRHSMTFYGGFVQVINGLDFTWFMPFSTGASDTSKIWNGTSMINGLTISASAYYSNAFKFSDGVVFYVTSADIFRMTPTGLVALGGYAPGTSGVTQDPTDIRTLIIDVNTRMFSFQNIFGSNIMLCSGDTITELNPGSFADHKIKSLTKTNAGDIFMVTYGSSSIWKYNGTAFVATTFNPNSFGSYDKNTYDEDLKQVYEFPEGIFAVSTTTNYVFKWNGASWDGMQVTGFTFLGAMYRDSSGTIWVTGDVRTVAYYNGSGFTTVGSLTGIANYLMPSYEDAEYLYFATTFYFFTNSTGYALKVNKATKVAYSMSPIKVGNQLDPSGLLTINTSSGSIQSLSETFVLNGTYAGVYPGDAAYSSLMHFAPSASSRPSRAREGYHYGNKEYNYIALESSNGFVLFNR